MMNDPYVTLGIDSNASEDQVKKSYRDLAKQYHPDKNKKPGSEEKFKEISAAYTILSDKAKREEYDLKEKYINKPYQSYYDYGDSEEDNFRHWEEASNDYHYNYKPWTHGSYSGHKPNSGYWSHGCQGAYYVPGHRSKSNDGMFGWLFSNGDMDTDFDSHFDSHFANIDSIFTNLLDNFFDGFMHRPHHAFTSNMHNNHSNKENIYSYTKDNYNHANNCQNQNSTRSKSYNYNFYPQSHYNKRFSHATSNFKPQTTFSDSNFYPQSAPNPFCYEKSRYSSDGSNKHDTPSESIDEDLNEEFKQSNTIEDQIRNYFSLNDFDDDGDEIDEYDVGHLLKGFGRVQLPCMYCGRHVNVQTLDEHELKCKTRKTSSKTSVKRQLEKDKILHVDNNINKKENKQNNANINKLPKSKIKLNKSRQEEGGSTSEKYDGLKDIKKTIYKKEKSTDCDSALIPLHCVHG